VYYDPEYQDCVAQAAPAAGALWIADEVVTGFARTPCCQSGSPTS